jgi:hypothetical protein
VKVTGNLCSVAGRGAPGIDDFGHRPVFTDTEFVADKKPDVCQELIHNRVCHTTSSTSTLAGV